MTDIRHHFDLGEQRAHWIDASTLAWDAPRAAGRFALHHDADAGIGVEAGRLVGGEAIGLTRVVGGLTDRQRERFPHLAGLTALGVPDGTDVDAVLRSQLAVSAADGHGLAAATGVQIAGVLDDRFASAAVDVPLGVTVADGAPVLRLWAPTARTVRLHRFTGPRGGEPVVSSMDRDDASGVWWVAGDRTWIGDYYRYEVEVYAPSTGRIERNLVTDPYSVALAEGSTRSQIAALDAAEATPEGWGGLDKPPLARHADAVIYELHVRDLSVTDDRVPAPDRGTFRAFGHADSHGMRHLAGLAEAGMTHLHLLPVFDFATVEEDPGRRLEPDTAVLAALPPDGEEQQALVGATADRDAFNWGYDPLHFTVPEGSYAVERDGVARTRELREAVAAINGIGLRVVLDVAYNHTHAAGQDETAVLDRIVPGYYHRLLEDGSVAMSTCCPGTAAEHAMVERLIVDSVRTWARAYKVDGFRFDLMGHHPKRTMLAVRAALDALTVDDDGVDGGSILLYGEGWEFGEVADDVRFTQATQANMAGTGIGTFNDRLRDAVRGGGVMDDDPREQGFATGLAAAVDGASDPDDVRRSRLLDLTDLVRLGLAGNLAGYRFPDRSGRTVSGADLDYHGEPAGYTGSPQESVSYVSKHDNETLFDALALKLTRGTRMADRVRLQVLALSTVALGQGVPFFHAGSDLLRSKSLDRNSYDSGDWFNVLDWTGAQHGFGRGLPPAGDNGSRWPLLRPLLADPELRPDAASIRRCAARFRELLAIRASSRLFRLGDARAVGERLTFLNTGPQQVPGVIVMRLTDRGADVIDPVHRSIVVTWNATSRPQRVPFEADAAYVLHPAQAASVDLTVRTAAFERDELRVPPLTTAVFVERR